MLQTCDLFARIARETAGFLGCEYPAHVESNIMSFAEELSEGIAREVGEGDPPTRTLHP